MKLFDKSGISNSNNDFTSPSLFSGSINSDTVINSKRFDSADFRIEATSEFVAVGQWQGFPQYFPRHESPVLNLLTYSASGSQTGTLLPTFNLATYVQGTDVVRRGYSEEGSLDYDVAENFLYVLVFASYSRVSSGTSNRLQDPATHEYFYHIENYLGSDQINTFGGALQVFKIPYDTPEDLSAIELPFSVDGTISNLAAYIIPLRKGYFPNLQEIFYPDYGVTTPTEMTPEGNTFSPVVSSDLGAEYLARMSAFFYLIQPAATLNIMHDGSVATQKDSRVYATEIRNGRREIFSFSKLSNVQENPAQARIQYEGISGTQNIVLRTLGIMRSYPHESELSGAGAYKVGQATINVALDSEWYEGEAPSANPVIEVEVTTYASSTTTVALLVNKEVVATSVSYSLAYQAVGTKIDREIEAGSSGYSVAYPAAGIIRQRNLEVVPTAYNSQYAQIGVIKGVGITAEAVEYSLGLIDMRIVGPSRIVVEALEYSSTYTEVPLIVGRVVINQVVSYSIASQEVFNLIQYVNRVTNSAYSVDTYDALFKRGLINEIDNTLYSIDYEDNSLVFNRRLVATDGGFSIGLTSAEILVPKIAVVTNTAFTLDASEVTLLTDYKVNTTGNNYVIQSTSIDVEVHRRSIAVPRNYTLSLQSAEIEKTSFYLLEAANTVYSLTRANIPVIASRTLEATNVGYSLGRTNVALKVPANLIVGNKVYSIEVQEVLISYSGIALFEMIAENTRFLIEGDSPIQLVRKVIVDSTQYNLGKKHYILEAGNTYPDINDIMAMIEKSKKASGNVIRFGG